MFEIKHFDELTSNELYEICKSRYEVFACEQQIFSENDFDDVDKDCYHIFKFENNKVISYARIIPRKFSSYEDASIGRVLVLKEYRRKNLAKEMMNIAINFITTTLNEEHITLSAQEYIKKLYLSCGFKEISNVYDEAGIPHIKMKLKK